MMEIYWDLKKIHKDEQAVLTVGTFDGVHLGHQAILTRLDERSQATGGAATLVTFEPHPQLILQKPARPPIRLLTTIDEKIAILAALGLDRLVILGFSAEFSRVEPETFVRKYLHEKVGFCRFIIGHDHNFGRGRSGNIDLLQNLAGQLNFAVEEVPATTINGEQISSTRIREAIARGDIKKANAMLGRPLRIKGQVVKGNGIGRNLGFPTANLDVDSGSKIVPGNGIYAGYGYLDSHQYLGLVSIGTRPTFNLNRRVFEVHLLDFDGQLYGQEIEVDIIHRLRDEIHFDSIDALVAQMQRDREKSVQLLG